MGIPRTAKKDLFWNYYLTLVKELGTVADFIEFDPANYSTYSTELAKLFMSAASEVDVVMKELCSKISSAKPDNINGYKKAIMAYRVNDGSMSGILLGKKFATEKVVIPLHGLTLQPWENWGGKSNPAWWRSYNNVKHTRNTHFEEATLQNTLNAMAGLLVSIAYLRALEDMKKNLRNIDEALSWGWGSLAPRNFFIRLDRIAYPLSPLD